MRLEAIAIRETTVCLPRLPFGPEVLEEGCGDIFGVGVPATSRPEEEKGEREAYYGTKDRESNLEERCQ